jgi:thiol-disulfide isomerase/thioredoxin
MLMKTRNHWFVAALVSLIAIPMGLAAKLSVEGPMPPLKGANAWVNSQALSTADLRGKVVLVDFWTYTCINWRRTMPYLRAWAEKYKDNGLVVVGVHTPEFSFEKDLDNVRRAAKELRVDYPIAVDNDYAIWNAFNNRYWPALYLIDAQGHVRHHQFGEGDYERLESVIQQLLTEAGQTTFDRTPATLDARGAEVPANWKTLATPETYTGYANGERFASPGGTIKDRPRSYTAPDRLQLNNWALAGDWTMNREFSVVNKAKGKVTFRFEARDVHLVMSPATRGSSVRFRVTIDGQPPGPSHGVDVDAEGFGTLDQPRMYQLIRQIPPIAERQIEIEFPDAGAQIFSFTFG